MKIHHFSQLLCIEMVLSGHFFYAPMAVRRKRCAVSGAWRAVRRFFFFKLAEMNCFILCTAME